MAPDVKALVFDVFGTVVDWRTCVTDAASSICRDGASGIDWGTFADDWRTEGYLKPIAEMVAGTRSYIEVETVLGETLKALLARHRVDLPPDDFELLWSVWRRLDPWPDVLPGLARLRRDYVLGPLSNGSFAVLTEMAKRAALPWDCVLSAQLFSAYKPDARSYLGAARLLGLQPSHVMMVAAHVGDLQAAASAGLRTAYVPRPLEWGPSGRQPEPADPIFDVVASDFASLADQMCSDGS
jgi:2-haloacid dehalogenase